MPTNYEVVQQYANAITRDLDLVDSLRHPDYVEDWPQSGERVRGTSRMRAIDERYPGSLSQGAALRIVGSEDRWVVGPNFNALRIEGTGDVYTVVWKARYPDGKWWHVVSIIQLKESKIWRATTFFAEEFEPPAWRSEFVERIPS